MTDDMIERVARALATSDRCFSDGGSWQELDPIEHDIYRASARAAISEIAKWLRQPTGSHSDFVHDALSFVADVLEDKQKL